MNLHTPRGVPQLFIESSHINTSFVKNNANIVGTKIYEHGQIGEHGAARKGSEIFHKFVGILLTIYQGYPFQKTMG